MLFLNQMLNWRVVLDILLLAAGMFFLYRTLLRLGTWKIIAGVFLAVGIFFMASLLDLKGITWVYRNVSHVALIALIVLFQPELRKFFERAALFRRAKSIDQVDAIANIIADSLNGLAVQRHGAIVVLPGREPIAEHLSGGYTLDGTLSEPVMMSVFDPHSPGHDGAMIIANGRLASFGVRLPVSQNTAMGNEYGTRHHAAMGLAEKTDALVILVSEERGRIRFFHNGRMIRVAGPSDIKAAIVKHLQAIAASPLDIREKKTQVFVQAGASLLAALMLWSVLFFSQSEQLEKIISVPVQYTVTAENVMLAGDRPNAVRLHISGPKSDLDVLMPDQLSVKIDLSESVAGSQSFTITEKNLKLPKNVRLIDVDPPVLDLTLAAIVREMVTIEPQLVGRLPEGEEILSIDVVPPRIAALIPVSDNLTATPTITTTPIYVENLKQDTKLYCKIIVPPSFQLLDKRIPDVEVTIKLKAKDKQTRAD